MWLLIDLQQRQAFKKIVVAIEVGGSACLYCKQWVSGVLTLHNNIVWFHKSLLYMVSFMHFYKMGKF